MKGILADLLIKLGLDSKEFNGGVDKAKQKTDMFSNGIKKLGGILAGAFAVGSIVNFGKELLRLADIQLKAESKVSQAVKQTGAVAGFTADQLKIMASELQSMTTFGDEDILSGVTAQLLTFTKISGDVFKRAQKAILDISTLLGSDLKSTSIQVGKALNDPILGLSMLGRSGIQFSESQKEIIKNLVASNKLYDAQTLILDEINIQYGGQAEAMAKLPLGRLKQVKNSWGDIKEELGKVILASDTFFKLTESAARNVKIIGENQKIYTNKGISGWEKFIAFIDMSGNKRRELEHRIWLENKAAQENNKLTQESSVVKQDYIKTEEELTEEREKAIKAWDAENEKIAKQIDLLEMIDDTKRKSIQSITSKAVNPEDLKPSVSSGEVTGEFGSLFQKFGLSEEKESAIGFDTEAYQKKLEQFNQFKEDMAMAVADFGVNVVEEFGQSIGEMIASGNFDFSNFGKNILAGIGGFISQLGKMLIQMGIAAGAFQKLLESSFMNPVAPGLLVAAGLGLVLLGGAIQGAAKAGPNGASSSGSVSAPSYSRAGSPSSGYRAEDNKVVFEIKGDKLVGVLSNVQRKNLNMA